MSKFNLFNIDFSRHVDSAATNFAPQRRFNAKEILEKIDSIFISKSKDTRHGRNRYFSLDETMCAISSDNFETNVERSQTFPDDFTLY